MKEVQEVSQVDRGNEDSVGLEGMIQVHRCGSYWKIKRCLMQMRIRVI